MPFNITDTAVTDSLVATDGHSVASDRLIDSTAYTGSTENIQYSPGETTLENEHTGQTVSAVESDATAGSIGSIDTVAETADTTEESATVVTNTVAVSEINGIITDVTISDGYETTNNELSASVGQTQEASMETSLLLNDNTASVVLSTVETAGFTDGVTVPTEITVPVGEVNTMVLTRDNMITDITISDEYKTTNNELSASVGQTQEASTETSLLLNDNTTFVVFSTVETARFTDGATVTTENTVSIGDINSMVITSDTTANENIMTATLVHTGSIESDTSAISEDNTATLPEITSIAENDMTITIQYSPGETTLENEHTGQTSDMIENISVTGETRGVIENTSITGENSEIVNMSTLSEIDTTNEHSQIINSFPETVETTSGIFEITQTIENIPVTSAITSQNNFASETDSLSDNTATERNDFSDANTSILDGIGETVEKTSYAYDPAAATTENIVTVSDISPISDATSIVHEVSGTMEIVSVSNATVVIEQSSATMDDFTGPIQATLTVTDTITSNEHSPTITGIIEQNENTSVTGLIATDLTSNSESIGTEDKTSSITGVTDTAVSTSGNEASSLAFETTKAVDVMTSVRITDISDGLTLNSESIGTEDKTSSATGITDAAVSTSGNEASSLAFETTKAVDVMTSVRITDISDGLTLHSESMGTEDKTSSITGITDAAVSTSGNEASSLAFETTKAVDVMTSVRITDVSDGLTSNSESIGTEDKTSSITGITDAAVSTSGNEASSLAFETTKAVDVMTSVRITDISDGLTLNSESIGTEDKTSSITGITDAAVSTSGNEASSLAFETTKAVDVMTSVRITDISDGLTLHSESIGTEDKTSSITGITDAAVSTSGNEASSLAFETTKAVDVMTSVRITDISDGLTSNSESIGTEDKTSSITGITDAAVSTSGNEASSLAFETTKAVDVMTSVRITDISDGLTSNSESIGTEDKTSSITGITDAAVSTSGNEASSLAFETTKAVDVMTSVRITDISDGLTSNSESIGTEDKTSSITGITDAAVSTSGNEASSLAFETTKAVDVMTSVRITDISDGLTSNSESIGTEDKTSSITGITDAAVSTSGNEASSLAFETTKAVDVMTSDFCTNY